MEQYIRKALEYSELLTITDFIKNVEYPIDMFMIDKFWNTLRDEHMIYVDDDLISWMGYQSSTQSNRKMTFMKLLPSNSTGNYYHYTNAQYENFLNNLILPIGKIEIYPPIVQFQGKNKSKHLLLTADCLRDIMQKVNTHKGDQVRAYYRALEKLLRIYIDYQSQFKEIQLSKQYNSQLEENNQKILLIQQAADSTQRELTAALEAKENEIIMKTNELISKESELVAKDKYIANTQIVNKELLSYKLFLERNETLYIITSKLYAQQGLFKVGKTKSLSAKDRLGSMNTGHVPGDDLFIAAEFKTNNAKHLEDRAHALMQHHRVQTTREWFHLPYPAICKIVLMLNENHNAEQDLMNEITQILYDISCEDPAKIKWDEGLPLMICAAPAIQEPVNIQNNPSTLQQEIPAAGQVTQARPQVIQFTFCIRGWTIDQTYDFITAVLAEYKANLGAKKSSWTQIHKYLTAKLKPHSKQPNVGAVREQILQLCRDNNIVLR